MPDPYGIITFDAQGQLGEAVPDTLSLIVFADLALVSVDTVVTDLPPNIRFIQVFLFQPDGRFSSILPHTYDPVAATLTFRNNSFAPSTLAMAMVW